METEDWLKLAEKLEGAYREDRECRLTPATALRLAAAARARAAQPSRDEVALAFCPRKTGDKCGSPCATCTGHANIAEAAYTGRKPVF